MNAPVAVAQHRADANSTYGIIDCDIHPFPKEGAIARYLPERWRRHVAKYGQMACGVYAARGTYPRFQPYLSRRDSFPPSGGPPGSDVDFIRAQLLDAYNIVYGVLEPLLGGNTSRNLDEAAALSTAMNDWQALEFVVSFAFLTSGPWDEVAPYVAFMGYTEPWYSKKPSFGSVRPRMTSIDSSMRRPRPSQGTSSTS